MKVFQFTQVSVHAGSGEEDLQGPVREPPILPPLGLPSQREIFFSSHAYRRA